jgi:hypothetical protein
MLLASAAIMSEFQQKLDGLLHYLTLTAIILGAILVVVLGVAIYLYRRNLKKELQP